jgi:hypothetical protein
MVSKINVEAAATAAVLGLPNRLAFAATADPQVLSNFFSVLPLEVRQMIYIEFWRLSGLRQHIFARKNSPYKTHAPCIIAQDQEDIRYDRFRAAKGGEIAMWETRLKSDWCFHWECEELDKSTIKHSSNDPGGVRETWSPFLPSLLACKRM